MYSSYFPSKCLVLVYILGINIFLIRSVSSMNLTNEYLHHKCQIDQGNYKSGSDYEKNLNFIIKSVSTQKFYDGFMSRSYGEAPNVVVIIFQCRGDSYKSNCRSCYGTAVAGLRRRCQRNKVAIIWYDQYILDVSTKEVTIPPKIDYNNTFSMHNPKKMSRDIESFNKKATSFLTKLMQKAIIPVNENFIYYATGEERLGVMKLYAMVQCIRNTMSCKECLEWSIKELSKCCNGKEGARVFVGKTCNFRYELYPFLRS